MPIGGQCTLQWETRPIMQWHIRRDGVGLRCAFGRQWCIVNPQFRSPPGEAKPGGGLSSIGVYLRSSSVPLLNVLFMTSIP